MAVKPIPEGYPAVIPYLAIDGAAEAIEFYKQVLGATETVRMDAPGGKIGHAELKIGDSLIMLADEFEEMGHVSPKKLGGSPVSICVYLDNVDAVYAKAIKAGATEIQAVEDKFYGDRAGSFKDPFGHNWNVMMHVEDVPPEEMEQRAAKAMEEMSGS
jgi:PhnB protein